MNNNEIVESTSFTADSENTLMVNLNVSQANEKQTFQTSHNLLKSTNSNEDQFYDVSGSLENILLDITTENSSETFDPNFSNCSLVRDESELNFKICEDLFEIKNDEEKDFIENESKIINRNEISFLNLINPIETQNNDVYNKTSEVNKDLSFLNPKDYVLKDALSSEDTNLESHLDNSKSHESTNIINNIKTIERSISKQTGSEKVVEVEFIEEKGHGLNMISGSTKSLLKYFNENSIGGTDVEGKNFFDSFTTTTDINNEKIDNSSNENFLDQSLIKDCQTVSSNINTTNDNNIKHFDPIDVESENKLFTQNHSSQDITTSYNLKSNVITNQLSKKQFSQIPIFDENQKILTETINQKEIETNLLNLKIRTNFNCTNQDRMFDSWIPGEDTRNMLLTILRDSNNVVVPMPAFKLCQPVLVIEESLGDPIRDLLFEHFGEQEANKGSDLAENLPKDEFGLRELIKADCLRAAVDLTGYLILAYGQGRSNIITNQTPYSLQLWFCRLSLLAKLKLYAPAECEWMPFGNLDSPDLYYEFYQDTYPNRKGSMVPFEMRILHAELPQYLAKSEESLDRFYYLLSVIRKILRNLDMNLSEDGSELSLAQQDIKESKELWLRREVRVLYCLVNCFLTMKAYNSSLEIFQELLKKDSNNIHELYSAIGRLHLQIGDIEKAEFYFLKLKPFMFLNNEKYSCQQIFNKALIEMGYNRYIEAYNLFKQVVEKDNSHVLAVNNMAVCGLYLGKLKDSLQQLELLIFTDPKRHLQEGVVLNLSTLYELESSKALIKKQNLLKLISQHRSTGFNIACLKMPSIQY